MAVPKAGITCCIHPYLTASAGWFWILPKLSMHDECALDMDCITTKLWQDELPWEKQPYTNLPDRVVRVWAALNGKKPEGLYQYALPASKYFRG